MINRTHTANANILDNYAFRLAIVDANLGSCFFLAQLDEIVVIQVTKYRVFTPGECQDRCDMLAKGRRIRNVELVTMKKNENLPSNSASSAWSIAHRSRSSSKPFPFTPLYGVS